MKKSKSSFASTVNEIQDPKRRVGKRPSIPFQLPAALLFFLGLLLAEDISWNAYVTNNLSLSYVLGAVSVLVALLSFARLLQSKSLHSVFKIMCLSASVAICSGLLFWTSWQSSLESLEQFSLSSIDFEVTGDPQEGDYGYYSSAKLVVGKLGTLPIRVYWSQSEDIPPCGSSVNACGRLRLPGTDAKSRMMHQDASYGSFIVSDLNSVEWAHSIRGVLGPLRQRISAFILESSSSSAAFSQGSALLFGIVLGDRSYLQSNGSLDEFKQCGLSHMVAVSGAHLVVVSSLLSFLFSKLPFGSRTRYLLLMFGLILYVIISGVQLSAVRSCIMAAFSSAACLMQRRRAPMASCSSCLVLMLAIQPNVAFSFSFRLSVLAVMGIICFSSYFESWISALLPRSLGFIANSFAVSLAAQFATLPLCASSFASVSLLAALGNLLISPLMSVLLSASMAIVFIAAFLSFVPVWLLHPFLCLANLICDISSLLAAIPGCNIAVSWGLIPSILVFASIAGILWLRWREANKLRARMLLAASLLLIVVFSAISQLPVRPQLVMLDVGQGDAILIREGRSCVLVDCGPSSSALLKALARNNVSYVDALFVSHLHDDHIAGCEALGSAVGLGALVIPEVFLSDEALSSSSSMEMLESLNCSDAIISISPGQSIDMGTLRLSALSPWEIQDGGANQDSLVMLLEYDGDKNGHADYRVLLCGDCEAETLLKLCQDAELACVDCIKLGHHGSAASLSEELLDYLKPQYALISVGADNSYGHPDSETLELLESHGIAISRSDLDGDVRLGFWDL